MTASRSRAPRTRLSAGLPVVGTAALGLLSACASAPAPPFDPNGSLQAQAAQFMEVSKKGKVSGLRKLALTSCTVSFGTETGASASTRPGLGEDRSKRGEVSVSHLYLMQGVSEAQLQDLTNRLCSEASARITAAGYELVDPTAVPEYRRLHDSGQKPPYTMKQPNGTVYTVFTPPGQTVIDTTFMSKLGAVGNLFKTVAGNGPANNEALLIDAMQVPAVHVNLLVDFAATKSSDRKGMLAAIAGSDSAKVESRLGLAVSGFVSFYTADDLHCIKSLSVPCSMPNPQGTPRVIAKQPIESGAPFYTEIRDAESTGEKAGELAYNIFAGLTQLAAATAGGTSAGMVSVRKDGVLVDYPAYDKATRELSGHFVDMALVSLR